MQKYRSPRSFSVSSPAACEPRHTPVPTSHGLGTGQGRGLGPRGHTTRSTSGDASAFSLSLLSAVAGPATPTGAANGGTRRRAETSTPRRRCGVGFTRTKKKSHQLSSPLKVLVVSRRRLLLHRCCSMAPVNWNVKGTYGPPPYSDRVVVVASGDLHHGPPFLQARHSAVLHELASRPKHAASGNQCGRHDTRRAGDGVRRPPRHVSVVLRPRASTAAGCGDWGTSRQPCLRPPLPSHVEEDHDHLCLSSLGVQSGNLHARPAQPQRRSQSNMVVSSRPNMINLSQHDAV
jgi:hypothetical protein